MLDVKRKRSAFSEREEVARPGRGVLLSAVVTLALLRIFSSYSWLSGAFIGKDAKFAPDFLAGSGLVSRITGGPNGGFVHTAINSEIASWLTHTVVPNASLFAWLLALGEAAVGISLLLGLFTRLGSVLAIAQCIVNLLVAGGSGADTIGHNYMLIIVALTFIAAATGRVYGLDGVLIRRFPRTRLFQILG